MILGGKERVLITKIKQTIERRRKIKEIT